MIRFGCMYIFLLMIASSFADLGSRETYQYFLDILDTMDPEWVYDTYEVVGTKIKCASLCYQDQEECRYFGFYNRTCYLMNKKVKRDECSQDNCTETGMKIYKLKREDPPEKFECMPPKGAFAELYCPEADRLIRAMASRSPFFADVLGALCSDMKEQIYEDKDEVLTFFSPDGGVSLSAKCPDEHQVIQKYEVCVIDLHIPVITLHCKFLKEDYLDKIEDHFNVTNDDFQNLVECPNKSAVQRIYFMDAGNGIHTRVVFYCIKIYIEDDNNEPDTSGAKDAVKDTGAGDTVGDATG